jgi:hypothetical protein
MVLPDAALAVSPAVFDNLSGLNAVNRSFS